MGAGSNVSTVDPRPPATPSHTPHTCPNVLPNQGAGGGLQVVKIETTDGGQFGLPK